MGGAGDEFGPEGLPRGAAGERDVAAERKTRVMVMG